MSSEPELRNLFEIATLPTGAQELFEPLYQSGQGHRVLLERIVSSGQVTPPDEWYDQAWDEWVMLLQGEAELGWDGGPSQRLRAGDSLMIPAGRRHRVTFTSQEPPCIWLALHLKPNEPELSRH